MQKLFAAVHGKGGSGGKSYEEEIIFTAGLEKRGRTNGAGKLACGRKEAPSSPTEIGG